MIPFESMIYLLKNEPQIFVEVYKNDCDLSVVKAVNRNIREQIIEDQRAAKVQELQRYYARIARMLAQSLEWVNKIDPKPPVARHPLGMSCA
jgi:hypothetical protein